MGAFRESGPFQVVIKGFRAAYSKGVTTDASFDSINVSWGTENGIRLGESKVSTVIDQNNIKVNYLLTDSVFGDEGEEFIYVMDGRLEFCYGDDTYILNPGDNIYFDSIVPHVGKSLGDNKSKLLVVIYFYKRNS